jgi:iron(III) transport system ATP-binding protein
MSHRTSDQHCFLEIENLVFQRGSQSILDGVSFCLDESSLGAIVGPSGSGKTTLLRLVAGFEEPDNGIIRVGGRVCSTGSEVIAPERRGIGVVFQDFALFPHLNVSENIGYAIHKDATRNERVHYLLNLLGLESLARRYPYELSGGQQQRVAIGRALAPHPSLLLLDEPFSQLDPELREELIHTLKLILEETRITTLLVTHHQEDAYDLAQWLGVLHRGKLLQWGAPFELYHSPHDRFVADFLGKGVFLPAQVVEQGWIDSGIGRFRCSPVWPLHMKCELLVRPDDLIHVDTPSKFKAKLVKKRFRGSMHLYTMVLENGHEVLAMVPSHHNHREGEMIGFDVDMKHVNLYTENI